MHATEIDFSPGTPSFMVTTRRRLTPQGTSFSFFQAVTQPLQLMQRSASQMNFMRAMGMSPFGKSAHQARSIWHTVVLVSCIMVTAS